MVKVMAINAGSSSLKFQLINMPSEEVITSGLVERIGLDQGNFEMKYNGEKFIKECPIKDHSVAVQLLLDALVDHHVVESLGEIEACGHRVVHGGEYYNDAVKVDEEVVARVEELAELAPLHNPAHIVGYNAFKAALPEVEHVFVFDTAFHQTLDRERYLYPLLSVLLTLSIEANLTAISERKSGLFSSSFSNKERNSFPAFFLWMSLLKQLGCLDIYASKKAFIFSPSAFPSSSIAFTAAMLSLRRIS
jgi:hypothetical protein